MRKIADTIARLNAQKRHPAKGPQKAPKCTRLRPLPQFGSNPGALSGFYYIPDDLPENRPLVVVLHGCTQTASGYDRHSGWSDLADEAGFALLYPEQQRGNNPNLCFNWFVPSDTRRHLGEVHSIAQMIEAMIVAHRLDRTNVFVTGLSAGGAMAVSMLATYPEVFAGGAVIAGLAHGMANTIPEAFDRMRGHGIPSEQHLQRLLRAASDHEGQWPRLAIWQGDADQTVAPQNAQAIFAQWKGVQELHQTQGTRKASDRLTREEWYNSAGQAVLQVNIVAGMGHGTPISSHLGKPGPFMLNVGISSTREIASFWGLSAEKGSEVSPAANIERHAPATPPRIKAVQAKPEAAAHGETPRPASSGIQKTIEDALRAAGLMR